MNSAGLPLSAVSLSPAIESSSTAPDSGNRACPSPCSDGAMPAGTDAGGVVDGPEAEGLEAATGGYEETTAAEEPEEEEQAPARTASPPPGALPAEVVVVLASPHKAGLYRTEDDTVAPKEGQGSLPQDVRAWAGGGTDWERRVHLAMSEKAEDGVEAPSGISLAAWRCRRMLQQGRCSFCVARTPDAACAHPEARYASQLALCRPCWQLLEPEDWKCEAWKEDG